MRRRAGPSATARFCPFALDGHCLRRDKPHLPGVRWETYESLLVLVEFLPGEMEIDIEGGGSTTRRQGFEPDEGFHTPRSFRGQPAWRAGTWIA